MNEKSHQSQNSKKKPAQKQSAMPKKNNPKLLEPMDSNIVGKISNKLERNSSAYDHMEHAFSSEKPHQKPNQLDPIYNTGTMNIGRYIESSTASTEKFEFMEDHGQAQQPGSNYKSKKSNRGIKLNKLNKQQMEIVD